MRKLVIPALVWSSIAFADLALVRGPALDAVVYANAQHASKPSTAKPAQPSTSTPEQKADAGKVNPVGAAAAAFQKRIDDYLKLRDGLTKTFPEVKETGDPNKITAREHALGKAIATARASARPGDILGGDMAPVFAQVVTKDWATRTVADRKALFRELPAGTKVTINQPYPTTLPLLTVPSNLLVNLPTLPEVLEYRIVDRHLMLRDRDANLIVDVLYNLLPRVEQPTRAEK